MIKIIVHLIVFTAGTGLGIWWGVNHPSEATLVANQEETQADKIRGILQARTELLKNFIEGNPTDPKSAEYKKMLDQDEQKLQGILPPSSQPSN